MARKTVQHKYFDEKLWEQVNSQNKELFQDFMNYMKASDKSPESIKIYFNNLRIFFLWCLKFANDKFFVEFNKKDMMRFQNYLVHEQQLSPNRVRLIRSSISSMANYVENFEDDTYPTFRNIINKVPAPALEKVREKTYLSEEQIQELLQKLAEKNKWQQALYVIMSFSSGARKAEVRQFRVDDFTENTLKNGAYKTHTIRCKGRGKIGKQRNLFVPKDMVQEWLDKWLEVRNKLEIDNEYLFVTKDKQGNWHQVNDNTFNKWCDGFTKLMGIEIYPHGFRSSRATCLKEQNKDITSISKLLGHNDISTTQIYIRPTDEEDIEGLFN